MNVAKGPFRLRTVGAGPRQRPGSARTAAGGSWAALRSPAARVHVLPPQSVDAAVNATRGATVAKASACSAACGAEYPRTAQRPGYGPTAMQAAAECRGQPAAGGFAFTGFSGPAYQQPRPFSLWASIAKPSASSTRLCAWIPSIPRLWWARRAFCCAKNSRRRP